MMRINAAGKKVNYHQAQDRRELGKDLKANSKRSYDTDKKQVGIFCQLAFLFIVGCR